MERIVNFFNRTVDIGSWLISCIAIYVVMLPAMHMPLIMGQQLLFFNKNKFQSSKVWCIFTRPRRKNAQERKIKGT